jgi:hypothetical protein
MISNFRKQQWGTFPATTQTNLEKNCDNVVISARYYIIQSILASVTRFNVMLDGTVHEKRPLYGCWVPCARIPDWIDSCRQLVAQTSLAGKN